MPVLTLPANPTTEEVLAALEKLEPDETEQIVQRLLHSQAKRRSPSLSEREAELLQRIYAEKRQGFQERFDALNAKRREFSLTEEEHAELLRLVDESENFTARRLESLGDLALLRGMGLPDLMNQLGLKAPPVV